MVDLEGSENLGRQESIPTCPYTRLEGDFRRLAVRNMAWIETLLMLSRSDNIIGGNISRCLAAAFHRALLRCIGLDLFESYLGTKESALSLEDLPN